MIYHYATGHHVETDTLFSFDFLLTMLRNREQLKKRGEKVKRVTFYKLPMKTIVLPQISRSTINSREQQ